MTPDSWDMKRLVFGTPPAWFALEVVVRSSVMYVGLLAILRALGKRLSGQLTILEMGIMITLGAIASGPIVFPDRGLMVGLALVAWILLLVRVTNWAGMRSPHVLRLTEGEAVAVVRDGRLQLDALRRASLSRELLFAELRTKGIEHLGQVRRVYLEACGEMSVVRAKEAIPGLSIFRDDERQALGRPAAVDQLVCTACGGRGTAKGPCVACRGETWAKAVR